MTLAPGSAESHMSTSRASEAPVDHLHVLDTDALHLGDGFAQTVGARGAAESHLVIQVTLARLFAAQVEEFVGSRWGRCWRQD